MGPTRIADEQLRTSIRASRSASTSFCIVSLANEIGSRSCVASCTTSFDESRPRKQLSSAATCAGGNALRTPPKISSVSTTSSPAEMRHATCPSAEISLVRQEADSCQ